MKVIYNRLFLFVLCLSMGWNLTAQTTGGPDQFGYTWINSDDPSGDVALNFIDIRLIPTSTQVANSELGDDGSTAGFIDMGIDFHFYWSDYNAVKLGSNGWISFDNVSNIASCFPQIPEPAASGSGNNLVVPVMTDFNFGDVADGNPAEMWYTTLGTQFIVSYYNVPFWQNAIPAFIGDNTFQVIFDSSDSSITFQYLQMELNATGGCAAPSTNSVSGIENISGQIGLSLIESGLMPPANSAVKFFYPGTVTFEVTDVTPAWNQNDRNGGAFYLPGTEIPISSYINNTGNSDVTESFNATAEISKPPFPFAEYTSTKMVDPIALGEGAAVEFDPFSEGTITPGPVATGTYTLEVSSELSTDLLPDNNINISELVVVDNTTAELVLSYVSPTVNPVGSISWSNGGGNSGMGVYYEPPFYPFTMNAVSFFAFGDGADDAYTVQVYSDQTVVPGIPDPTALISLADVQAGSYDPAGSWVRTDLPAPLVINEGGIYVAWVMQGNGCAIGTEESLPVSRRSLEFIGGGWTVYRSNKVNEVSMRVHGEQLFTSIEEAVFTSNVSIFPNPSHDKVNIQSSLTDVSIERVQVYNTLGEKMLDNNVNIEPNQVHTLNLSALSGGVYYMTLTADGSTITKKISLLK